MFIWLMLTWLPCAALGFYFMKESWLHDFPTVTVGDAILFAFLSLLTGPLAVAIGAVVYLILWADSAQGEPTVLWRRKQ